VIEKISRYSRPVLALITTMVALLIVMLIEVSNGWIYHKIVFILHKNSSTSYYFTYVLFSILILTVMLGAYIGYQLPPKLDKTLFEKISWGLLFAILTSLLVLPCVLFIYVNIFGS
jgi:hypothetical protein